MRPPPLPVPRPTPRVNATAPAAADAHDRPTPRSTVIPRLPLETTMPIRPRMPTLIFHGAPPLPASAIPRAPITRPEVLDDHVAFDLRGDSAMDVRSDDLIEITTSTSGLELLRETPNAVVPHDAGSERAPHDGRDEGEAAPPRWRGARGARAAAVAGACAMSVACLAWLGITRAPDRALRTVATTPPAQAAAKAPPAHPGLCSVTSGPRLLARRALLRGGVEATSVQKRLGFAAVTGAKEGTAFELDPATFAVASTARVVAAEAPRRVVPALTPDAPLAADVDPNGMRLVADPDGDAIICAKGGYVVWGAVDEGGPTKLWKLDGAQDIEAARVVALGASGDRAVAFRRGNAIWIGAFRVGDASPPLGAMVRLSDGTQVGAPAMDARGDEAVVAWAQRETKTAPWSVHWTRWRSGAEAEKSRALPIPPGGPGERALAPSVALLDRGRFLLAWTEGATSRHQVRAQVIDENDHPVGEPMAISPAEVVAGQEQIAIAEGGRGAVAYLSSKGRSFELMATPIACDPL